MAKHKPRRPKKHKIKKEIEITFQTPRNAFANGIIASQKKFDLFEKVSPEEILNEMKQHGIFLSEEEVLNQYETTFSIENTIQFYHQQFEKELDKLENSPVLFDDDCFIFYIQKLIKEKYNSWETPDPDIIFDYLDTIDNIEDPKHLPIFLSIITNLNRMKDYQKTNVFNDIFVGTYISAEGAITDMIMDIHNIYVSNLNQEEMIGLITDELFEFVENYELEFPEQIYEDACGLLAMKGYANVKQKFEEGLTKYPNHKIRLHNGIIDELYFYGREHNSEYENFIAIYKNAMRLYPVNDDEREIQALIKENYELEIRELMK